jgi:hypothetical protein
VREHAHRPVRSDALERGRTRAIRDPLGIEAQSVREHGEVDAAVVRDHEAAVVRQLRAVRAARQRDDLLDLSIGGLDSRERARRDQRDHQGAVGAPYRSFAERSLVGDDLVSHGLHDAPPVVRDSTGTRL